MQTSQSIPGRCIQSDSDESFTFGLRHTGKVLIDTHGLVYEWHEWIILCLESKRSCCDGFEPYRQFNVEGMSTCFLNWSEF